MKNLYSVNTLIVTMLPKCLVVGCNIFSHAKWALSIAARLTAYKLCLADNHTTQAPLVTHGREANPGQESGGG